MRLCGLHALLLFSVKVVSGVGCYSLFIYSLCRFLEVGKRADDIRSREHGKEFDGHSNGGYSSEAIHLGSMDPDTCRVHAVNISASFISSRSFSESLP